MIISKTTCSAISRSIIATPKREVFRKSLPTAFAQLQDDIQDYFTHMECAGPKLAHYAGYIIGNLILPWVEPGYREDSCTMAFAAETKKLMGMLPL